MGSWRERNYECDFFAQAEGMAGVSQEGKATHSRIVSQRLEDLLHFALVLLSERVEVNLGESARDAAVV